MSQLFASGNTFDPIAYPLLLDTLYYLIDGMHRILFQLYMFHPLTNT